MNLRKEVSTWKFGNKSARIDNRSELGVSENHKVYAGDEDVYSSMNSLAESNLKILPLNSLFEDNNVEIMHFCDSKSLGWTLNNQMPKCSDEIYALSKKSLSRVINNLCSETANLKTSPFLMFFGHNLISYPNLERKEDIPLCTFSSNRNFILFRNGNHKISFTDFCGEIKSGPDMFFGERWVSFKDFFESGVSFKHLQNYVNHDSCALEGGLSMTDFAVNDDVFINLDSHGNNNAEDYINLSEIKIQLNKIEAAK